MSFLAIPFPSIDPVAIEIGRFTLPWLGEVGPIAIRWYGIAYMAGLVLGWLYIRRLLRRPELWPGGRAPFTPEKVDDLLLYIIAGVLVGGRLGSVLFYEPGYYLAHPLDIVQVWKGGMSFHGALLGCGVAVWVFARRNGTNAWSTMDLCAAAVPIGLFFGRVANFVNGELFGRPTSLPWGMVFPDVVKTYPQFEAIEPAPRHPSQLYEAIFEGLLLFALLRVLTHRYLALKSPGLVVGTFLLGYGVARAFCELFRQPDPVHALTAGWLTPGIAYSIPMVLLGLYFVWAARTRAGAT